MITFIEKEISFMSELWEAVKYLTLVSAEGQQGKQPARMVANKQKPVQSFVTHGLKIAVCPA